VGEFGLHDQPPTQSKSFFRPGHVGSITGKLAKLVIFARCPPAFEQFEKKMKEESIASHLPHRAPTTGYWLFFQFGTMHARSHDMSSAPSMRISPQVYLAREQQAEFRSEPN
jgi:hypothetical protein